MPPNDLFKLVSLRPVEEQVTTDGASPLAERIRDVRAHHRSELARQAGVKADARVERIASITQRRAELAQLVDAREKIQRAIYAVDVARGDGQEPSASLDVEPADTEVDRVARVAAPSNFDARAVDAGFLDDVTARLGDDERVVLTRLLGRIPRGHELGLDLDTLVTEVAPERLYGEANALCTELRALKDSGGSFPTMQPSEGTVRPVVSAIGWGDLVVAREALVGYVAREIAHVENVMPGETKLREHQRTSTTEQVDESETTKETETERESQSTDRYELQAETQETLQQDFSIRAGVNTSGRYGLTKVNTSLDTAFRQSSSQSQSTSMETAREVVSKAVERTFERVRQLRRLTITEQIREINRHRLTNNVTDGDPTADISGIYLWLEKIHRVELRHYGTRLMLEFHIPEPALSLLQQGGSPTGVRHVPFDIGPHDVSWGNYLCLAQRYAAMDVQPPPPMYVNVGYTWASAPNEEGEKESEDTMSETIAIPAGYRPVAGNVIASALEASSTTDFDLHLSVGGVVVVQQPGSKSLNRSFQVTGGAAWPNGVPVSGRVHGHFDKTMAVQVVVRCERMSEAYTDWQLRTWESLRAGYEALVRRSALDEQQRNLRRGPGIEFEERMPADNRRVERQELQKWAIKAMRLRPHQFNAVEQVGDRQEVSPVGADLQAPIVRMFEDAFEWDQMTYFLYPYYWARRETWDIRRSQGTTDPALREFMEAGAARVIVPVTPGFEAKVMAFLESDPDDDELTRIQAAVPDSTPPAGALFPSVWDEILVDRRADLARGSGTLQVTHGKASVTINPDSNWTASARDVGRELYVSGERVVIADVLTDTSISLEAPYPGETDAQAIYVAGSVPFGPPWTVRVPTSLVVLAGNRTLVEDIV